MDNLWIEEQIYPLDCAADYDVPRVASVIAQAHEEELAKMEHRYQQANQMDRDIAGMSRTELTGYFVTHDDGRDLRRYVPFATTEDKKTHGCSWASEMAWQRWYLEPGWYKVTIEPCPPGMEEERDGQEVD